MCVSVSTNVDYVGRPYTNTDEEERPGKVNRRRQREVYSGAYLKSLCRPPVRINVSHAHKCSVSAKRLWRRLRQPPSRRIIH